MFLNNFDFELRDLKGLAPLTLDGYVRNTDFRQIEDEAKPDRNATVNIRELGIK